MRWPRASFRASRRGSPFAALDTGLGVGRHEISVDHWLAGHTTYAIEVPAGVGSVSRVEVDATGYTPDVDRSNNLWPRG